jgi:2-keto-4-pentenoate hydratase/2-oxohepta-3-ene-1,7-dioic acid hydratase in catechol pathway
LFAAFSRSDFRQAFLKDGDTIELHVDKIGVLRNKVVRQK